MKIVLETIPVWDGLKSGSECFICDLMKDAERDGIRYYLSSAIMTPEIRVETNTHGFCAKHFSMLAEENKAQSLGLVMDTYYEENKKGFYPSLDGVMSASSPRKAEKAFNSLFSYYESRKKGCLICSRMDERLERYAYTVAALFSEDPEFKAELKKSKGFCIHHTKVLVDMAPEALKGDILLEYYQTLADLMKRNLERVQADDYYLTQKYKSENRDKPWNGCEDAAKRAVYKFIGEAEVIDPVRKK